MTVSSSNFQPAYVERVRIINVNIDDWTIDCVSEYGNKRFLDIQVMSPYFHYMNGEGIYVMPEVGALAWVCKPSDGTFSQAFLLGFGAPHDDDNADFRCGRQSLNPGDIMLRTRDENFIILRRGGVVQVGATPMTQRMYIPLTNLIHDFCENYRMDALGGSLEWITERPDKADDGAAPTKFVLRAKMNANEPAHVAELTIGNQGKDDKRVLDLVIRASGADGAQKMVSLQITKEGNVLWELEKDWSCTVKGNYRVTSTGKTEFSSEAEFIAYSKADMTLESGAQLSLAAKTNVDLTAGSVATVDAKQVRLGGSATEPAVKGLQLVKLLTQLIQQVSLIQQTVPPASTTAGPIAALAGSLNTILSQKVKVE